MKPALHLVTLCDKVEGFSFYLVADFSMYYAAACSWFDVCSIMAMKHAANAMAP